MSVDLDVGPVALEPVIRKKPVIATTMARARPPLLIEHRHGQNENAQM
jgi:hypothetical protein